MEDQRLFFTEVAQQAFLDAFPADGPTVPFASREDEWLKKWAHPVLHEFWAHVGLGTFGRGYLHLIDPTQWHELLCGWVAGNKRNPARIPFARTAFGDLIYFRNLIDRSRGDEDGSAEGEFACDIEIFGTETWVGDASFLDVHYRSGEVFTWEPENMIVDLVKFIRDMASMSKIDFYESDVLSKFGPIPDGQAVFPVPALALGGSMSIDALDTGDARVHVDLLLQMASG